MKDYTKADASLGEDFEKKQPTDADISKLRESQLLPLRRGLELIRTNMVLREGVMEVCCQLQESLSHVPRPLPTAVIAPIALGQSGM
jgi:hypothetical protein